MWPASLLVWYVSQRMRSVRASGLVAQHYFPEVKQLQPSVNAELCTHPGRTVETWKTPFDGANGTQAGSLCSIGLPDCRAISQRHPGGYRRAILHHSTTPLLHSCITYALIRGQCPVPIPPVPSGTEVARSWPLQFQGANTFPTRPRYTPRSHRQPANR